MENQNKFDRIIDHHTEEIYNFFVNEEDWDKDGEDYRLLKGQLGLMCREICDQHLTDLMNT